ncbi:hypothetical protein IMCC26207_110178 [Actinobacteria bacterium IMCC26207]|nr:hypothetical protein IMCC26207_110178 [Actinobacteria bacterium IMCC26207]
MNQLDDLGVRSVAALFEALQVDELWSVTRERGFTWWSYRLAQRITASPVWSDGSMDCTTVRISTEVVVDVDSETDPCSVIAVANMQSTLSAVVWDPETKRISESCSVVVTDGNFHWLIDVLATAAILQNAAAHGRAFGVAELVGGKPAASDHPLMGCRAEMDEMLRVPEEVILPEGQGGSRFAGPLLESLASFGDQRGVIGSLGDTSYTCELPYTGRRSVAEVMMLGEPVETSLLVIETAAEHPVFGSGALLILRPPPDFANPAAAANQINQFETTQHTDLNLLGAWCPDATKDETGTTVAFTAFIPNMLARRNLLENLLLYQADRSQFAATQFAR